MLTIVDADIAGYRCACANANADLGLAVWQIDQLLSRILEETEADDWILYLSGENNFRYSIFPDYKANRRNQPKPIHLESLREHMVLEWNATIVDGYEADDAIGIELTKNPTAVVASIDKDLKQLPGRHYNFVNRILEEVSEFQGWKNFYSQLLTGDATDNIKGCPGIGKVKAERALGSCETPRQLYERCVEQYTLVYGADWERELNMNAQLLYVWRKEDDSWTAPQEQQKPEPEAKPSS